MEESWNDHDMFDGKTAARGVAAARGQHIQMQLYLHLTTRIDAVASYYYSNHERDLSSMGIEFDGLPFLLCS